MFPPWISESLYTTIPNRDGLLALVFVFVFYFYVILMLKRFASKQGHRQSRIHSKARVLRPCLHGVGDPGLVGLVSFVFTLWGHKTKQN